MLYQAVIEIVWNTLECLTFVCLNCALRALNVMLNTLVLQNRFHCYFLPKQHIN